MGNDQDIDTIRKTIRSFSRFEIWDDLLRDGIAAYLALCGISFLMSDSVDDHGIPTIAIKVNGEVRVLKFDD